MHIYCLFCETQKCAYVQKIAESLVDGQVLRPRQIQHTWKKGGGAQDIVRDLLPGYLFLYCESEPSLAALRGIQGVIRLLSNPASGCELEGQDRAFALMLREKGGVLGKTKVYQEGQTIRICEGAFAGTDAKILRVERRLSRMQVQLPFANHLVKAWVEFEIVQAAE